MWAVLAWLEGRGRRPGRRPGIAATAMGLNFYPTEYCVSPSP